ncbi:MAG: superoxide dismutase family protein [Acidimicrobiales bacterium]|nr:superoxide dismutase family protein [Acidimicrobiales bacterium]
MIRETAAAMIAIAMLLGACGSSEDLVEPAQDEMVDGEMVDGEMGAGAEGMEDPEAMDGDMSAMGEMNMGDINATPADEVADADLQTGSFELLETRPTGYDDLTGSAAIARSPAGTTVTIDLVGLEPETDYIAHLHSGVCSTTSDHYMFDPSGPTTPPNEIHLAFTSAADGSGAMTAENAAIAGPEGQSVIVHRSDLLDNKIACAQFS